ncbi:MAG: M56 family metallopeptidase [Lachnospiraceae bacterium]|nr:M56 family metallopeptidase [Lachnospiraceae bacterium]
MSFLEMTFAGGVMVLVITALRAVLLNKLPKRTFIFLWEIAMLRLVLPISIPAVTSVYSLFSLFGNSENTVQTPPKTTVTNIPIISSAITEGNLQAVERPLPGNAQAGLSIPVCAIVWLVGMVIVLAVFVVGYISVYRRYRCATIVKGGYVEQWLSEQKIRRNVQIRCSKQAVSPLTYGILCPTIVLPQGFEDIQPEQLTYILMHEMTHIRRFDMLRKIAAAAVLCIQWFNPAVWVLFLLYNRDIELACDEAVVRKTKGDCRSAYSMALIGMEEKRRGFSSLYNHFSRNAIEERIVAIMKFKKISVAAAAMAGTLVLGVTSAFATSATSDERKSDKQIIIADKTNTSVLRQGGYDIDIPDVEWWTYDEYKAWLDNEKIELQRMLGKKGWTGSRGDFVWTQEIIDETIAMYENILEEIKSGVKVSKSVDGAYDDMLIQGIPDGSVSDVGEPGGWASISKEELLERFGNFGISFNSEDKMLYNGEPVRYFFDGCEVENGGFATRYAWFDENGVVDVYTIYETAANGNVNADPFGKLVGLRKASQEEFDALHFAFKISSDALSEGTYVTSSTFEMDKNFDMSISGDVLLAGTNEL